ncbi:MAG TPA: MBL fold metallo-hydrolase [Segeticoccus sp.]|jgi:L-ascorbate metabolism protein UlaG (beta-lactamase superfamily)|nr:MBL fold metallo-hydrolase [Segeticoccus sp.]
MHVTHLGHACLLIESGGARVLLDPGSFSGFAGVTGIDAVFVTHQHPDHVDPERFPALLDANPQARCYVEPSVLETTLQDSDAAGRCRPMTSGQLVQVGEGLSVEPVGDRHAVINEALPRIGNLGVVLRAQDERTLFHPGDAYDAQPGDVDILGLPLNAPWCAAKETVAFVQRIDPRVVVPIHDGLLNDTGRAMYIGQVQRFGPEGLEVRDLSDGEPVEF